MKYTTETYIARKSYSSHNNLSLEEATGIEANNYNQIPDTLKTPFGEVQLYDSYGDYLPIMPYDNSPWKLSPSGWATHKSTGVKVKLEQSRTPDYSKVNGCGDMTTTITVKIPKGGNQCLEDITQTLTITAN